MAYRRRTGITKAATFKDEVTSSCSPSQSQTRSRSPFEEQQGEEDDDDDNQNEKLSKSASTSSTSTSLAARATRASAAHRDSSGYATAYASPHRHSDHFRPLSFPKGSPSTSPSPHPQYQSQSQSQSQSGSDNMSMMTTTDSNDDPKYGFWGVLARKAKSILEDEPQQDNNNHFHSSSSNFKSHVSHFDNHNQIYPSRQSSDRDRDTGAKIDNARFRKRLDAITSSLNNFGDSLGNAFEEGRSLMEHKTADIIQETRSRTADFIQETRKLQLRRRGPSSDAPDQPTVVHNTSWQRPVVPSVQTNSLDNQQTQLKASRDVAMATAAKAKVLLRELKTVKADLAFAKERCAQLEEENKRLRENREKGDNPADDDLIRLQLETLLAEKARLAHENSLYARENRFLREIVEYHQLTMQDVVYLDEGTEEVTEVYPFSSGDAKELSSTPTSPISPKDVSNASSYPFPSTPLTVCPTICPPERTESSEVPASSKLVADEETETSCDTEPFIDAYEAPK